ncbi:MAG: helix-turn-helix domain-containing protein [Fimbriimonadaceae bacterium]|nr:helix-turn-helix domain-containing protein [Fimbriimonadaceae bacterium]
MGGDELTQVFRALADPTRRRIFEFLAKRCGPVAVDDEGDVHSLQGVTVGEVCCHITGTDKFSSTVSFHIRELRLAGLINAEKKGKFMVCSVRSGAVQMVIAYLRSLEEEGGRDGGC